MKTLRRFLADSADLLFALLALVGLHGPRWEFRKQRLRNRLLGLSSELENVRRGVRAEHKMCRECRTLIPKAARRCPECGTSTRGVPRGGFLRVWRLLFPGMASLTAILMTLNFAYYLVSMMVYPGDGAGGLFATLGPSWQARALLGGKVFLTSGDHTLGPPLWQLYRLVMPNLLHGGLLHILMNSMALMNLGPLVEELAGRRRLAIVYGVTGIAAFGASYIFSSGWSVGASGALFGLMGFLIVLARRQGGPAGRALSRYLMTWAMFGVIMFFIPMIDSWAHAGGFVAGAALGAVMRVGPPRTRAASRLLSLGAAVMALVLAASVAWVIADWGTNVDLLG